jgi:WG containing repeat
MRYSIALFALAIMFVACSVLTKKDFESDVTTFLKKFEADLAISDSTALRLFDGTQSKSSILTALRELRSPEKEIIVCSTDFSKPTILSDSLGLRAVVNVLLTPSSGSAEQVALTFWLERVNKEFSIKTLDAEQFHSRYSTLLYETMAEEQFAENARLLKPYIDAASQLQNTYDSVIWFVTYPDARSSANNFYYVINGSWQEPDSSTPLDTTKFKMGLVGEKGNVLVPARFDLIGSPGAMWPDVVEVQKGGKVGYYSLKGKELSPPIFDRVIPYSADGARAIVKLDTANGWLDNNFVYHTGYPSVEAKQFISSYKFLAIKMTVNDSTYALCRIPLPRFIESGAVVLPKYLVDFGLFNSVTTDLIFSQLGGTSEYFSGTEYIEKGSFDILDLSGNMKLLISAFKGRFIGGREEFYHASYLTLVKDGVAPTSTRQWGESVSVRQLNDSILEAKTYATESWEPDEYGCINAPYFIHFIISKDGLEAVPYSENRWNGFTKYARLDSSYFIGTYNMVAYDEGQKEETLSFAPTAYLRDLQAGILAANGYVFQDATIAEKFGDSKWYMPLIEDYDKIIETATEHDRHNLKFLEAIVGRPKEEGAI